MLNRAANALYWMCRYLERAESTARLIEVNLHLSLDLPGEEETWKAVVETTGDREHFHDHYEVAQREAVLGFLAFDSGNPNSVLECVKAARENARTVREYLPTEAWEGVNTLNLQVKQAAGSAGALTHLEETVNSVRAGGRQLEGALEAAFSREEGWYFSQLGRQCERADQTSRLVDVNHRLLENRHEEPSHASRWEAVLKSASGLQMYRRRHGATEGSRVAEFLILDSTFPRSVAFALRQAEESLRAVTGTAPGQFNNAAEKSLGKLAAELRYTDFDDVLSPGVHHWLDSFQTRLNDVGAEIQKTYFDGVSVLAAELEGAAMQQKQQQQQ